MTPTHEPTFEEELEAVREGDTAIEVSSARAAFRNRHFRVVWYGAFASGIGTWMQNVVLGAYAYRISGSAFFVSVMAMFQLGPQLILPFVGGALADSMDRRRLIICAQVEQLLATCVLALVSLGDEPNRAVLLGVVFLIGVGGALNAPVWTSLLPSLVGRAHLSGAMALNSTQMNAARVIGPALGSLCYASFGVAAVFGINAVTYLFAISTILAIPPQPPAPRQGADGAWQRLAEGFRVVRRDPVLRWVLGMIVTFSLVCLPFLGQFPTIAERNLDLDTRTLAYGLLYGTFGVGAVVGALAVGTFLSGRDLRAVVRAGLAGVAATLGALAVLSSAAVAFPVAALLGFSYFAAVTSLFTILQNEVDDHVRGRVVSLWQVGWAGMFPLGVLVAGAVAEVTSIRLVLAYGAAGALALVWLSRKQ